MIEYLFIISIQLGLIESFALSAQRDCLANGRKFLEHDESVSETSERILGNLGSEAQPA